VAKANSPIRLDASLMAEAAQSGLLNHRSTTETIEYWADLGKQIAKHIDPASLLKVQAGTLKIDLRETNTKPIDPNDIFSDLESKRATGTLNSFVNREKPVYQACRTQPGKLEQVMPDGEITIGLFQNGKFIAEKGASSLTNA